MTFHFSFSHGFNYFLIKVVWTLWFLFPVFKSVQFACSKGGVLSLYLDGTKKMNYCDRSDAMSHL